MQDAIAFPPEFQDLACFSDWALPTTSARVAKRREATPTQIREFYNGTLQRMDDILRYLNGFEMARLPGPAKSLSCLALAFAEIALYVEWFDGGSPPATQRADAALKLVMEPE